MTHFEAMKKVNAMDVHRLGASEAALDSFSNKIETAFVSANGLYYINGVDIKKGPLSAWSFLRFLERLAAEGTEV